MELIHQHFDLIDSTNTWAKRNAPFFPHDKITLVTADAQSAGRGRFNRRWESPAGQNIIASFCFFVEKHRQDIGNIPQVMALSALQILKQLGLQPELKWPNDVLISKKKIVGILTETTPLSDQLCVIIGIGLNVNMQLEVLNRIDRPATSLLVETGHLHEVADVLKLLEKQFVKNLDLFFEEGFMPFLAIYREAISINQQIRFNDNKTVWSGVLHGINVDGSLCMQLPSGELKTFVVGEILWPHE